ncbi:hypothetical protein ACHAXS_009230 [Conticribra weissflogii]
MNLSNVYLIATAIAVQVHSASGQAQYYPDWMGGTNTCLNDGNQPSYMNKGGYLEATLQACCTRYFSWNYNHCMGGTAVGSAKWYVDYANSKCVQDCASSTSPAGCTNFGGLATPADVLYPDAASCCTAKLSSIAKGFCEAKSTGTTYAGSMKWYVDYENSRCEQDCKTAGGTCITPGGIIEASSTTLYDSASLCCAGKLSYINTEVCASNSNPSSTGTGKYYPDPMNYKCLVDTTGSRAPSTTKTLYSTASDCCGSMTWIDKNLCSSRSTGTRSDKWFLKDLTKGGCVKDCSSGVECAVITDPNVKLYDTAAQCCTAQLSWIPKASCESVSTTGSAVPSPTTPVATNKWYSSTGNVCKQDCATSSSAPTCGGIDSLGKTLYSDPSSCCAAQFSWIDKTLCAAMSTGTYTNKFYVNYSSNKCQQDCSTGSGSSAACGGHPADLSVTLYSSASDCCKAKLGSIDLATCTAVSTGSPAPATTTTTTSTGSAASTTTTTSTTTKASTTTTTSTTTKASTTVYVATNKWYSSTDNICKQDCAISASAPTCGGIAKDLWKTLYSDASSCCAAQFSWIDKTLCAAMSTGTYTNKFYVNYSSNKCQQDCATGSGASSACGGHPADLSVTLYSSASDCCKAKLGSINLSTCTAASTGTSATGTSEYYVDWSITKCVKNCPISSSDSACGGLAETWEKLFPTKSACCSGSLSWLEANKC